MGGHGEDPNCPECGEPIGQTATYCMHCSADLTAEQEAADTDGDEAWEQSTAEPGEDTAVESTGDVAGDHEYGSMDSGGDDQLLDPDGIVDGTLTVLVGLGSGVVIGLIATIVLTILAGATGALLGVLVWLGSTAYLVRRRTVQGAVAKSGYAAAVVLLMLPLVFFSPSAEVDGGVVERITGFGTLFFVMLFPAAVVAGIGWVAGRFVPDDLGGSEG